MYTRNLCHLVLLAAVAASPFERATSSHSSLQVLPRTSVTETPATFNDSSSLHVRAPSIPFKIYIPDDDPKKDEHESKIRQAWSDATALAAFMHASLLETEPVFKRYFEEENAQFVLDVLGFMAHYENPDRLDGTDPSNLKKIMESDIKTSPKFAELIISYNDHPDVLEKDRKCEKMSAGFIGYAYTYQTFDKANMKRAIIVMCDTAFRFPSLDNIKKDVKASREEGPGCKNMGSYDSGWMTSLGGLLLHEFTHWQYFLQDVDTYKDVVKNTPEKIIDDYDYQKWEDALPGGYWPSAPSSGYGAFDSMLLNDNPERVPHMARINADNYRWYAQSKWWSFKCEKAFDKPKDDAGKTGDKMRSNLPE